ncbi:diguanylate cyclase [Desulfovibrio sp. JY]|nr:diguanylate cyclase [Desulfovibrio sp. JY]
MRKKEPANETVASTTQHHSNRLSFSLQLTVHSFVVLFLVLLIWGNLFLEHGRIEKREKELLQLQTHIVQNIVEQNLADLNTVLKDIQRQGTALRALHGETLRLDILADALSGIRVLSVYDVKGVIEASNRQEMIGKDFSQRDYFKTIQQQPNLDTLYISAPFQSVLGARVICIGRMIGNAQNQFDGIVNASLDPAYFAPLLGSILYAPDMWAALADADGSIFVAMPQRERKDENDGKKINVFLEKYSQSGVALETFVDATLDHDNGSMVSMRSVNPAALHLNKPLTIIVTRSVKEIYKDWRRDVVVQNFILFLVISFATLALVAIQKWRRDNEQLRLKAEEEAARHDKFTHMVMDNIPAMVAYWNKDMYCEYANKIYYEWFGKTKEQIYGAHAKDILGDTLFAHNETRMLGALRGEPQMFEQDRTKADGSTGHTLARYIPDQSGDSIRGFFVLVSDVTELKETQFELQQRVKELHILATTDSLTGLSNRRYFIQKVMEEITRAKRYAAPLVFLMVDIDHFKSINDTYGHDVGDAVLRSMGEVLQKTMRETDHIGRLGGEEFGILLIETSRSEASNIAERLRKSLENSCAETHSGQICFTVSIGLAFFQKDKDDPLEDMLRRADNALYQAKNNGRNQVCCDEDM